MVRSESAVSTSGNAEFFDLRATLVRLLFSLCALYL